MAAMARVTVFNQSAAWALAGSGVKATARADMPIAICTARFLGIWASFVSGMGGLVRLPGQIRRIGLAPWPTRDTHSPLEFGPVFVVAERGVAVEGGAVESGRRVLRRPDLRGTCAQRFGEGVADARWLACARYMWSCFTGV